MLPVASKIKIGGTWRLQVGKTGSVFLFNLGELNCRRHPLKNSLFSYLDLKFKTLPSESWILFYRKSYYNEIPFINFMVKHHVNGWYSWWKIVSAWLGFEIQPLVLEMVLWLVSNRFQEDLVWFCRRGDVFCSVGGRSFKKPADLVTKKKIFEQRNSCLLLKLI